MQRVLAPITASRIKDSMYTGERFQIQSGQVLYSLTEPSSSAVYPVQGPPERVMTPDQPNDVSLLTLVQAVEALIAMCCIRPRALLTSLHT